LIQGEIHDTFVRPSGIDILYHIMSIPV
jgi:hypothetical protein